MAIGPLRTERRRASSRFMSGEGTDRILGATVVARHAGEMINGLSLAISEWIGLRTLAKVIHTYPTQAEAIKMAAEAYSRTRLTPALKSLSRRWLTW